MFKVIIICITSLFLLAGCSSKEQNNIENNTFNSQKTSANQTMYSSFNNSEKNSTNTQASNNKEYTEKELATFSTKILVKESGRQHNLHLTCDTLNGTRIEPGETFSFCNTVGKATKEKGYEEADVYDSEGNVTKGLGGGNCQISSTLYNAVLAVPDLEVIERHEHSRKVTYVEKGKDAAVAYGSVDFRFKNNTGKPIRIYANTDDCTVTTRIVSISN